MKVLLYLWRRHISVTVTILDIIQRPVFYLKHDLSEAGFCRRLQVEPTQLGPVSGPETEASCSYWAQLSRFHLKAKTESSLRSVMF
jgi:hypothetical protein